MIAAYQRISRADGDLGKDGKDKSNSIENQKELILRYISCKESLQNVPVMDFVDDGYTGSNFDRPGFQQMMDGVRNGKIDTIIVKDLSRFGRDYVGVGEYMEQIFPLLGVRLIAINDNYDSNNYKGTTLAGIYADEGISGTQVKHRVQFQQMIEDAKAKKIDLILTKSISRFARNVVDCLTNIRLLRNLRPPVSVYFDKERLDSLDEKAEVFLTMLASFAQEESRSISTNIKWATRSRMKAGTQKISTTSLLGYDTDDDGEMVIVTNEAEIVRTIYMSFDKGMHPAEIAEKLNALEIRTIKNNPWTGESVKNILRNEKYCGDVLMQKTYTVDCLTHKTKKNEGEVEQYFIPDHHPAIVEREIWDKAQVRLEQIAGKRRRIRPKQQRLVPLRKGVLLGFVPIRPTWKAVSFKRLETATEKVMALVDAKPEQIHIEYESEECEMEILKGFEVINLKQPKGESVMTVTSNSLKFNKATAVELNYAPYIKVLLNAKTRQIAIQPCSEKDPNAVKFSNEESKQTYAISIKVPAIQVEFRRMLPFEDDNGGKLSYTLNGTLYPDEQVVIYDIGDVKPETEKKRRGRRKKSEIEAEQKEN